MQTPQFSPFVVALSRFANSLAALGAIYLLPLLAREVRGDAMAYLAGSLGYQLAYWGSWVVIVLIALCAYFGGSALLQILVHSLAKPKRKSPHGGM